MIERVIQCVMETTVPSSDDNLVGFEFDAHHYFGSNDRLHNATVSRTNDNGCMVEMRGEITAEVTSLHAITGLLNEIWRELAYSHFYASSIEWYKEATNLRFVTVISADSFYVTGRMVITGPHYLKLVAQLEPDFQRLLPSFK
jgi:hypothetical protein